MKILLLPLDSRPCNYIFPSQLAALQDVEVITPSISVVGTYTTPCNFDKLQDWFFNHASSCDAIVVAIDMLVFGSLLNSRKMDVSLNDAISRLSWLETFKQSFPAIPIYAYNVIMRTTISTLSQNHVTYWEKVNLYCQNLYLAEVNQDNNAKQKAEELQAEIPAEILEQFFFARKRNHEVNRHCISLLQKGVFEELLLLQEDSSPYGMHKTEQQHKHKRIQEYGLEKKCFIHNGTDESGCLMTAIAICNDKGLAPTLTYEYAYQNQDTFIASYEDRPFHQNLMSQIAAAGISVSEDSNTILYIFNPKEKQVEAECNNGYPETEYTDIELDAIANTIATYIDSGKQVGLLDLVCANGGYGKLLDKIAMKTDITKLTAYSAWNTASNALGTMLAQLMLTTNSHYEQNCLFTLERLLDDYAYQAKIRPQLRSHLHAIGEDAFCLSNQSNAEDELHRLTDIFLSTSPVFHNITLDYTCCFPWARIFEATYCVTKATRKELSNETI